MRPIEQAIDQAERWLARLDHERDAEARAAADVEVRDPFLEHRLAQLEAERTKVLRLLDALRAERLNPVLLLPERPCRALKVTLRKKRETQHA